MAKKKLELVFIEWADAVANSGWYVKEDAIIWGKETNYIVQEVGWILDETKDYILLAGRRTNPQGEEGFGALQKIPKSWVRTRQTIKLACLKRPKGAKK